MLKWMGIAARLLARGLIARYREWLPIAPDGPVVTLGEGSTPLVEAGALSELLADVRVQLDRVPDTVFLTGGMSRSPEVQRTVSAAFPDSALVRGNASLGVVSGLAAAAGG